MSVFKKLSRLLVIIEMMLKQLKSFLVLLVIILCAFASAQYIAFGYHTENSYTWFLGFLSLIDETFGSEMHGREHSRILGTLYRILFAVAVGLLLLNLVIAIMTTAYETALSDTGDSYWASRQFHMITSKDISRSSGMSSVVAVLDAFYDSTAWLFTRISIFFKRLCKCGHPPPRVPLIYETNKRHFSDEGVRTLRKGFSKQELYGER